MSTRQSARPGRRGKRRREAPLSRQYERSPPEQSWLIAENDRRHRRAPERPRPREVAGEIMAPDHRSVGGVDRRQHTRDAEREQAWAEIEQQLRRFEGPNGCEVPGELLIGVGTK